MSKYGKAEQIIKYDNYISPTQSPIDNYHADKFELRAKCKIAAKSSSTGLRDLFNDTTRHEESADQIYLKKCESIMYRARLELQPKIPMCPLSLLQLLRSMQNSINFSKRLLW